MTITRYIPSIIIENYINIPPNNNIYSISEYNGEYYKILFNEKLYTRHVKINNILNNVSDIQKFIRVVVPHWIVIQDAVENLQSILTEELAKSIDADIIKNLMNLR